MMRNDEVQEINSLERDEALQKAGEGMKVVV